MQTRKKKKQEATTTARGNSSLRTWPAPIGSTTAVPGPVKLLRAWQVMELTGASRTTLWRWQRNGTFPAPLQIGPNFIAWLEDEVMAWVAQRPRTPGRSGSNSR